MFFTIKPYLCLNNVLMLNWIIEIELFLTLKLYLHYAELTKMGLFWPWIVCKQNLYLY